MSFARNVQFTLKSGQADEFNRLMDKEVLPLLNKEKGFKQDLTVFGKDTGMSISVWDDRASAEKYNAQTYPTVLKALEPVLAGTPRVETFDKTLTLVR
jgi:quinol monooxygenase YgiN